MSSRPVFYSFRRCPYAMRARMALAVSGQQVELREVVLRDKPPAMIAASPKATVPVLLRDGKPVLEESLDIMLWALRRNDPLDWLTSQADDLEKMLAMIAFMDGSFKQHLDNYKYATRHTASDEDARQFAITHRDSAMDILAQVDRKLSNKTFILGGQQTLLDVAIAPFVRQFANTDSEWFAAQPYPHLQRWLSDFIQSDLFLGVMEKYPQWQHGDPPQQFPEL